MPVSPGYGWAARGALAVMRLLRWRCHVTGAGHVPPAGGAIITWNHHGHLDGIPVALAVHRHRGRQVRVVVHRDLLTRPLLGPLLRTVGALPAGLGRLPSRQHPAGEALRHGELVMIAPEGHISTSPGLGEFRTGAARLAAGAGVPLVPAATWGTRDVSTTGHRSLWAAWRVSVEVAFARPIPVSRDADPTAVTRRLRAVTGALLAEVLERARSP